MTALWKKTSILLTSPILFHDLQGGFIDHFPVVYAPEKVKMSISILWDPGVTDKVWKVVSDPFHPESPPTSHWEPRREPQE